MNNNYLTSTFSHSSGELFHLANTLPLTASQLDSALEGLDVIPRSSVWKQWLVLLLLALGCGLFLSGVVFFFAYNWEALDRFARFALLGGGVFFAAIGTLYLGIAALPGRLMLLVASVLTGVLLATFGMVYQTGADTYQLFASWALLISPWVLVSRFQPLWCVALIVINVAVMLWLPTLRHYSLYNTDVFWWLILTMVFINGSVLVLREATTWVQQEIDQGRWFPRLIVAWLIAILSVAPFYIALGDNIFDEGLGVLIVLLSVVGLLWIAYFYLFKRQDLLVFALVLASLIVISTTALAQALDIDSSFRVLLIGFYIVFAVTIATKTTQRIMLRWSQGEAAW